MQFLRRHQYLLCFLAVLVFACVMVIRQFEVNQSAHIERREDFIFLAQQHKEQADHLYQVLIQELPGQSEKSLVEDLERTAPLVDTNATDRDGDLIRKYHVHIKQALEQRSEERLGALMKPAQEK